MKAPKKQVEYRYVWNGGYGDEWESYRTLEAALEEAKSEATLGWSGKVIKVTTEICAKFRGKRQ